MIGVLIFASSISVLFMLVFLAALIRDARVERSRRPIQRVERVAIVAEHDCCADRAA